MKKRKIAHAVDTSSNQSQEHRATSSIETEVPALLQRAGLRCPQCRGAVDTAASAAALPFCSDRCKTLDLGAWAEERYRVPVEESAHESEVYSTEWEREERTSAFHQQDRITDRSAKRARRIH